MALSLNNEWMVLVMNVMVRGNSEALSKVYFTCYLILKKTNDLSLKPF
ncbi:hypothetical protein VCHA29O37_140130 [Vibrio chagasii]|nr:hypothetical protein VCHA29O37_140130 [Vibrio chagasii]